MNRDFMLLTSLIETNKKEIEEMPAWQRMECYYNCESFSRRHFRESIADTLRSIANKIDPIHLPNTQMQV